MYKNNLFGALPPKLGSLENLLLLDVSLNNLLGKIEAMYGDLHNLMLLHVLNKIVWGDIDGVGRAAQSLGLDEKLYQGETPTAREEWKYCGARHSGQPTIWQIASRSILVGQAAHTDHKGEFSL